MINASDAPWIAETIAFLSENDVEPDRIKVIRDEEDLRPVDVLCNLSGFGDAHKVRPLSKFIDLCMHANTQVFMDIRKGSGAFPFLKDYGTNKVQVWMNSFNFLKKVGKIIFWHL